jgi:acyl-CoA reductase-like NAD-dependent aldehyde dehydrogenase
MDILNYIDGSWVSAEAAEAFDVINPATGDLLARTPLCGPREVEQAASAAHSAAGWRRRWFKNVPVSLQAQGSAAAGSDNIPDHHTEAARR